MAPLKVLLFITTHLSAEHLRYMRTCWPALVQTVPLIGNSDVLFYSTGPSPAAFKNLFKGNFSEIIRPNPGYQQGAIQALTDLKQFNWAARYDWVVRLNPDVLINNDSWFAHMMAKPRVSVIFASCFQSNCVNGCTQNLVHTDFMLFRPVALKNAKTSTNTNAEHRATEMFSNEIAAMKDRWVPHTRQNGSCRIQHRDVVHSHNHVCN